LPCIAENTIIAFLGGRLSPAALAEVEAHLATCAACMDVVATAAPGTSAGRSVADAAAARPGSPSWRRGGGWRRALVVGGTVLVLGAGAAAGSVMLRRTQRSAPGGNTAPRASASAARLNGIWEPAAAGEAPSSRRAAIRKAFLAAGDRTGGGGGDRAARSFAAVARLLDRYADGWLAAADGGEIGGEMSRARRGCLEDRLAGLAALSDELAAGAPAALANAGSAALSLAPLDRCLGPGAGRGGVGPGGAVPQALRASLARVKALVDTGQCRAAEQHAEALWGRIGEHGSGALLAQTFMLLGTARADCGRDGRQTVAALKGALWAGQGAGDDEVVARAAIALMTLARGGQAAALDEAIDWNQLAVATLRRMGGDDRLDAARLGGWASVLMWQNNAAAALPALQEAVALVERAGGADHPDLARPLINLASGLVGVGRHREALAAAERAIVLIDGSLGADDALGGYALNNLGEALNGLGRYTEANAAFARALRLLERGSGAGRNGAVVAFPLMGQGLADLGLGRPAEAVLALQRALAILEGQGAHPVQIATARAALDRARSRAPDR
jgi:tetratricopeptide (TPR) repeat protein